MIKLLKLDGSNLEISSLELDVKFLGSYDYEISVFSKDGKKTIIVPSIDVSSRVQELKEELGEKYICTIVKQQFYQIT